ncbi:MAG: primosomal protein N', partial [Cocleimonas sp.]|nr:primosomal protein N' [Cocleimonas sp.]
ALQKKELIQAKQVEARFIPSVCDNALEDNKTIILTDEQQTILSTLDRFYQDKRIKPVLLHGITGSGKTEIYLRTIKPILKQKQQVLILVPEIGLTPQLFQRFQHYFPHDTVAVTHSALSKSERTLIWQAVKNQHIDILIGTRSAVFAPLPVLGIIIVDEEHDSSFKQQEGFRYHGRDLAVKRAFDLNIPIILGSATPALESLQNVELKRYHYLRLNSRPGTRKRPEVVVYDIRGESLEAGLSSLLLKKVKQHIKAGNQAMLFLNRRGFAPLLYCPSCGWHASCPSCNTNMTYHAGQQKTICHHCYYQQAVKSTCPECHHEGITTQGQGTERIEHVLTSRFPETPVIRIDRDTTNRKDALNNKLKVVNQGKPVILIGTQMLTKGHDFPNLTLVGILDIDQALSSMDYRAQEQLAQQIVQVSGRAGRGEHKGQVLLQTSQPKHPLLTHLLSKGYLNVCQQLLSEREMWNYPPFGFQVLIRTSSIDQIEGLNLLYQLNNELTVECQQIPDISLFGPVASPLEKRANRYRAQLLISSKNRRVLHQTLSNSITKLQHYKKPSDIRWSVDVDPLSML